MHVLFPQRRVPDEHVWPKAKFFFSPLEISIQFEFHTECIRRYADIVYQIAISLHVKLWRNKK